MAFRTRCSLLSSRTCHTTKKTNEAPRNTPTHDMKGGKYPKPRTHMMANAPTNVTRRRVEMRRETRARLAASRSRRSFRSRWPSRGAETRFSPVGDFPGSSVPLDVMTDGANLYPRGAPASLQLCYSARAFGPACDSIPLERRIRQRYPLLHSHRWYGLTGEDGIAAPFGDMGTGAPRAGARDRVGRVRA
jgi:hypothetical protein